MIVAAVLMVAGVAGAAETPEPPTVRLQLKNEARVPDDVLEDARNEVARIFARAGFDVHVGRRSATDHGEDRRRMCSVTRVRRRP